MVRKVDTEMPSASEGDGKLGEVDTAKALQELWDKRKEFGLAVPAATEASFVVSLRGGSWTAAKKGIAHDCWLASCKNADTKAWCRMYGLPCSGSFSILKFSMELGHALADEWAHRHHAMHGLWLANGGVDSFVFASVHLESIADSAAAATIVASGHAVAIIRLDEIRAIKPKLVGVKRLLHASQCQSAPPVSISPAKNLPKKRSQTKQTTGTAL